jgi:CheY-like chemotaxis protein
MAKTLLLADDSVTIQKVVNISFASEDVTLVTVDNGDDAVERAKETRPDLILADVVMPGKSGYEVCETIKADPDLCHIPVLLLTGTFEAFDEERAASAGAAGHVAKPFEAQTLVNQVNRLLAEAPPAEPAREPGRLAHPEALTAAVTRDVPSDDSFDFFNDDFSELSDSEVIAVSDAGSDEGSAFAFGAEDINPVSAEPMPATAAPDLPPTPDFDAVFDDAPDRTVAILPDDDPGPVEPLLAAPQEAPPTTVTAALADDDFTDPGDELLAVAESDAEDSFATVDPSATSDEAFDFAFERESTAPEAIPVADVQDDDPMSVEAEDLARATVLDPNGASGYDVSSSDLGDPFGDEIISTAEAAEEVAPSDATRLMATDSLLHEPVAAAAIVDAADAGEVLEPAQFASEEDPMALESTFEPPPPPAREARPLPPGSAVQADAALAEMSPMLREKIHDTLEKIAWESFGNVTEKIVAEVVDRVEKIAWEVVPQLTEALIKAEIRRLKGDSEG